MERPNTTRNWIFSPEEDLLEEIIDFNTIAGIERVGNFFYCPTNGLVIAQTELVNDLVYTHCFFDTGYANPRVTVLTLWFNDDERETDFSFTIRSLNQRGCWSKSNVVLTDKQYQLAVCTAGIIADWLDNEDVASLVTAETVIVRFSPN